MRDKPSKSGLIDAIGEARGDPLSLDKLQRLWQADYGSGISKRSQFENDFEESLGALSGKQPDGAMHSDLGRMLEQFDHPAMIVRFDGRIEAMNLRARRSIEADPGNMIDDIGYELVPAEALSKRIGRFLALSQNAIVQMDLWQVTAKTTDRTATLAVFRDNKPDPTALLFILDPIWKGEAEALARRTFGLTAAESEILAAFLNGSSLRTISEDRRRSQATVRTQFQAIMTKFGVRTQAELARSTLGLSQFIANVEPLAQIACHPHRRHAHVLRPGGRRVEVFLAGDLDGMVVIYLAECTLNTFAAAVEDEFHKAGLCVVSVSRPGYGASSPPPNECDDLECMADDVEAVIGQLGARTAVIAGHGTSAGFAFALASARPHLVERVVVFSGTVPRPHIEESLTHAPFAASLLRARDASPNLFRLIVRTSGSAWRRLGTRRFNSLNLAGSASDSAVVRSAPCVEEFDQALGAELANGYARLEDDLLMTTDDWSDHVAGCKAPTILLHGAQDPVTNIATVENFAKIHDVISVVKIADAGYLLHCTHTNLFVRILRYGYLVD